MNLNVVTVKTGDVPAEYVYKMRSMLERHLKIPFRFWCITDDESLDVASFLPEEVFRSWWDKMFLFCPYMPEGRILYFDLDMVILQDITAMVESFQNHAFVGLKDPVRTHMNSSIMSFESRSLSWVWEGFMNDPESVQAQHEIGGDQDYLSCILADIHYLDDDWPGAVKSYKFDIVPKNRPPDESTLIVNFHGHPRPHHLKISWIQDNWQ